MKRGQPFQLIDWETIKEISCSFVALLLFWCECLGNGGTKAINPHDIL